VDTAYNGQQAIDLVKNGFNKEEYSYGLIFMDCSMPIMNGYEASDLIREFALKNHLL
jgi:CheY-like chemotaxis protein